jgi:hypothetical protein
MPELGKINEEKKSRIMHKFVESNNQIFYPKNTCTVYRNETNWFKPKLEKSKPNNLLKTSRDRKKQLILTKDFKDRGKKKIWLKQNLWI